MARACEQAFLVRYFAQPPEVHHANRSREEVDGREVVRNEKGSQPMLPL